MKFSLASAVASLAAFSTLAAAAPTKKLAARVPTDTEDVVDDADSRVTYSGDWTHLTNLTQYDWDPASTLSYTNDPEGSVSIPYGKNYFGFSLIMGSKADRGRFSIQLGDKFWFDSADAHGTCSGNDCPEDDLFINFPRLYAENDDDQLVFKNVYSDDRVGGTPFLAFNYVQLHKINV
ncbi:hypothetical protein JCM8547_000797 [Rhodosporidiobolus lusitaniae]